MTSVDVSALLLPPAYVRSLDVLDRALLRLAERSNEGNLVISLSPPIPVDGTDVELAVLRILYGPPVPEEWARQLSYTGRGVVCTAYAEALGFAKLVVAKDGALVTQRHARGLDVAAFGGELCGALAELFGPVEAAPGWARSFFGDASAASRTRVVRWRGDRAPRPEATVDHERDPRTDPDLELARAEILLPACAEGLLAQLEAYEDTAPSSREAAWAAAQAFRAAVRTQLGTDPGPDEVERWLRGRGWSQPRLTTALARVYRER